jgi:hypothetical protein
MAMPPGDYLNALNIDITDSSDGDFGLLKQTRGRDTFITLEGTGTHTVLRLVADEAQGILFTFYKFVPAVGDTSYGIYYEDVVNGTGYDVLGFEPVVEPEGNTDWQHDTFIEAECIGDYLVWINESGVQYRINWKAAINKSESSVIFETDVEYGTDVNVLDIALIKRPPAYTLTCTKIADAGVDYNFIREDAFRFQARFTYGDGAISTLSAFSHFINVNTDDENESGYNAINIKIPLTQKIPKEINRIDIIAKKISTGALNIVKSWTRDRDETEIDLHDAGTTALEFDFYNDIIGEAIDTAYGIKQFDSVPVTSGAIEVAKNRVFLGDNTEGYDTPVETSLTATVVEGDTSSTIADQQALLMEFEFTDGPDTYYYAVYAFYLSGVTPPGYYIINGTEVDSMVSPPSPGVLPAGPFNIDTDLTAIGGIPDFKLYVIEYFGVDARATVTYTQTDVGSGLRTINGLSATATRPFKSDSGYKFGIQFYDPYFRKCGVVTNDDLKLSVPDRDTTATSFYKSIDWALSNTNRLAEIPLWAKYYSIVRTDNLSTRYFVQGGLTTNVFYVTYDADNIYQFVETNKTYSATATVAIAIGSEALTKDGLGYSYAIGDIIKLYNTIGGATPPVYELQVTGTQGKYILAQAKELVGLDPTGPAYDEFLYEIRTPYKPTTTEPFYETGDIYDITGWGTAGREYSTLSGSIVGDVYVVDTLERMNPNNKFYNFWFKDLGRTCFEDSIGQVVKKNYVRWSNTFIPGTKINGFNSFDEIDEKDLPVELGQVNKLQLTSKVQTEGTVMLAIGSNRTASLYLGETNVIDNTGQSLLATSGQVVGTVNTLKGNFGTTCPSSVVEYDGNVYWIDLINEAAVRYSLNGLYPISDNKMRTFFKNLISAYKETNDPYNKYILPDFMGGFNPIKKEYVLTFPLISESATTIADASGSARKSDILNQFRTLSTGRTVRFNTDTERWDSFLSYTGTYADLLGVLYSASGSVVYKHALNSDRLSTHFIAFRLNEAPKNIKLIQGLSVESSVTPNGVQIETFQPNTQITTLVAGDFEVEEGVRYSPVYRDRISPNKSGTADEKMYKGDKMRGYYADIAIDFSSSTDTDLRGVNVNVKDSIGHKINQE